MQQKDEMKIESLIYQYIDSAKSLFFKIRKRSIFFDYSKNEVLTIIFMYRRKKSTVSEIAEYIESPLNTATGVISRLEKKNIVERKRDEKDKRIVNIILTDEGKNLCDSEKELYSSYFIKVFNALDDDERKASIKIIDKIIKALKEDKAEDIENKEHTKKVRRINIK